MRCFLRFLVSGIGVDGMPGVGTGTQLQEMLAAPRTPG